MTFNIQNASIINVEGNRNHKNCKAVYCITTGEVYASVLDAAEKNGVSKSAMSWAISGHSKTCKGKRFCLVHQIVEHLDEIAENSRAREAKVVAHDAMIAKQNAIRKLKNRIADRNKRVDDLEEQISNERALIADDECELRKLENN